VLLRAIRCDLKVKNTEFIPLIFASKITYVSKVAVIYDFGQVTRSRQVNMAASALLL
jgi:hypothetical protein